jgi:nucleoside-diphosphate-sugar epimerase
MRVFLAGASGVFGRQLLPRLLDAGHEVVGLTRKPGSLAGTGAEEFVADLSDRSAFLRAASLLKFDAVIHEATALRRAPARFGDMVATNRLRSEGTNTLVALARIVGARRFVAASIVYGYGFADHGRDLLDDSAPFGETPEGRLAETQDALLALEQQVRAIDGVILRYGLFYSTGQLPAPFSTDWDGVIPWVHLADAADATVLALEKGVPGAVYDIVDDEPASWRAVNTALAAMQGKRAVGLRTWFLALVAPFAVNLVARTNLRVSNARAKVELGWEPAYPSYRDGLTKASVGARP